MDKKYDYCDFEMMAACRLVEAMPKLAAGNPNLMRENRKATLSEFPRPEKTTYKYGQSGGYVPMPRTPDMAAPRTFNHLIDGQLYKPDNTPPARTGATDALQIQSRGYKT